jgi:hypothetical protein
MNVALRVVFSLTVFALVSESASAQGRLYRPKGKLVYSFRIPPGWYKEADDDDSPTGKSSGCRCARMITLRWFHPRGHTRDVLFYIRIPNYRTSVKYSNALRDIVAQPPHVLDEGEQAMLKLDEDEEYVYTSRKTVDIANKRVLISERRRLGDSHLELVVRVGRNDRDPADVVEEIGFSAPPDLYRVYLPAIKKALDSISWGR